MLTPYNNMESENITSILISIQNLTTTPVTPTGKSRMMIDDGRSALHHRSTMIHIFVLLSLVFIVTIIALCLLHRERLIGCYCLRFSVISLFTAILVSSGSCFMADIVYITVINHADPHVLQTKNYVIYRFFSFSNTGFRMVFSQQILMTAIHRCIAVIHPLKSSQIWIVVHTIGIIASIWSINIFIVAVSFIYATTCCSVYVEEDILFSVEYAMFCINVCICVAVLGLYIRIAKEIKKRNMKLKELMNLKTGANYRTIIFCMTLSILFVITYLPLSLSVIIARKYYVRKELLYLYLIGLIIDPALFIAKKIYEKCCCKGNGDVINSMSRP